MTNAAEPPQAEPGNDLDDRASDPVLARILKGHLDSQGISTHALARRVAETTGIPELLSRSTIRNWISGSSRSANDWTQIIAIATVLKLDSHQTNGLLASASLPDLVELQSYPQVTDAQETLLLNWPKTQLAIESPDQVELPHTPENRIDFDQPDQPIAIETTAESSQRRSPFVLLGTVGVLGTVLLLFVWQASIRAETGTASVTDTKDPSDAVIVPESPVDPIADPASPATDKTTSTTADTIDVPPVAAIASPSENSSISHGAVFSGTAAHPEGIAHIEAILQNLDAGIYWNPSIENGVWQQRNQRFIIAVDNSDAPETTWKYDVPTALPEGHYRLRTWARSAQGRGDPVGPLVEFEVVLASDPDVAYRAAVDAQAAAIPQPADAENSPKTRIRIPEHGAGVGNPIRLRATTEHEDEPIAQLTVTLYSVTTDTYWNFDSLKWQNTADVRTLTSEPTDENQIEFDVWLPDDALPPGTYSATAESTTETGITSNRKNTFTVIDQ